MMLQLVLNVGTLPAACQVEPEVSSSRSSSSDVGAAHLRQVIQRAAPGDAATDDDDSCLLIHGM